MSKGKLVNYCVCVKGSDHPDCPVHGTYAYTENYSGEAFHEDLRLDEACRERPHLKETE